MGAVARVVVSCGCRAVLGSPPNIVSLAPKTCRSPPLLPLPSSFGRFSANKSENIPTSIKLTTDLIETRFLFAFAKFSSLQGPLCFVLDYGIP